MAMFTRRLFSMGNLTAEHFESYLRITKNFEQNLKKLKIISLEEGKCIAEMKVEQEHTNILGTLHGGFTASLIDVVSSYGLNSLERGNVPHVSVNLNVRYIKGAELGKTVVIESEMVKCGRNLAFLEVTIKDKISGEILAKGDHTKYLMK
ncbi:hypothetical protein HHI36_008022 [Cryptolaemus montrouzieri]|uniref:Acyl-coenzyme A thioesterase 13 n=1 Tax=Cryptolaemus montrouzieri TaxID=559131 RepID=A0ABD2MRC0_9CUCU